MAPSQYIKVNVLASIPVFLVAIPLCLGIALATNTPLFSGIITGVIGGIIVGLLSESRVSVSGPAAGMIAVVLAAHAALSSYGLFLLALCLAGVIQFLCGALRTGFIANYVPSTVIKGLLAAIGVIIIIKQLPFAFGYFSDQTTLLDSTQAMEAGWDLHALRALMQNINIGATCISAVSLLLLCYWDKLPWKWIKAIPSSCSVVIVAIIINEGYKAWIPSYALESTYLVNIPIVHNLSDFVSQLRFPSWEGIYNSQVYIYAFMLAMVASLETLLNLEGIEKIDKKHKYCSRDRELIAQGAGNFLSGLVGGLPITSVIVRSSVNIYAGATGRLSSIAHGLLLLLSITLTAKFLNYIPISALASILIYTGFKLAPMRLFVGIYEKGYRYFIPFLITFVAIIVSDLLIGILVGLAASLFFILKDNSKNCFSTFIEKHPSGSVLRLMLPQQVNFLNRASIIAGLNAIAPKSKVVIDASSCDFIDDEILEVLQDEKDTLTEEKNILFNLEGFQDHYAITHKNNFIQATTYDVQSKIKPDEVLTLLREGNQRFVDDTPIKKNYKQQMVATEASQHPLAVVLGCIDSRVPVELIFNLSLGDVFVARVAGNVANDDILASIEFACHVAGAKLIVVLGHKACGAVKAACEDFQLGHLTQLIEKIKPAVALEQLSRELPEDDEQFLVDVTKRNVALTKAWIYQHSPILRTMIDNHQIKLIGAYYDISTGIVEFED